MSLNNYFSGLIFLLLGLASFAHAELEGKLGPIRTSYEGVNATIQADIQESIRRDIAAKQFTGNKDRIYALYLKVRKIATEVNIYNGKRYGVGQVKLVWQVSVQLSEFRPGSEDLAAATFRVQAIDEGLVSTHYNQDEDIDPARHLREFFPARLSLYFDELNQRDISAQLQQLEVQMATAQSKVSAIDKIGVAYVDGVNSVGRGIAKTGRAVGKGVEFFGDPDVAASLNKKMSAVSAELTELNRQNEMRALEVQEIMLEARNANVATFDSTDISAPSAIPVRRVAAPTAGTEDTAKMKCLARGAQWQADKRICTLERSVEQRRKACVDGGGVLFEQDYICWKGMANTNGYVSEDLRRTAPGGTAEQGGASASSLTTASSIGSTTESANGTPSRKSSATSGGAQTTCEPINQQGVRIPKEGIPEKYWCYMFSDERLIEWNKADQSAGDFFYEAADERRAKKDAEMRLREKAQRQCRDLGFSGTASIFNAEYQRGNLVRASAVNCRKATRMGSEGWMCDAEGSFRCGQRQ